MTWHKEVAEKLNSAIVAARLMNYNVLHLKHDRVWIVNGENMIQVYKEGEKCRLNYVGIDHVEKVKRYTIEELEKKIIDLL